MIAQKNAWISVDVDGFLEEPSDWTEEVATVLAAREGIQVLRREQLHILKYLRTYYGKHRFFPIIRSVCKNVHQPRSCVADQFNDPVTAWKIAGLGSQKPTEDPQRDAGPPVDGQRTSQALWSHLRHELRTSVKRHHRL